MGLPVSAAAGCGAPGRYGRGAGPGGGRPVAASRANRGAGNRPGIDTIAGVRILGLSGNRKRSHPGSILIAMQSGSCRQRLAGSQGSRVELFETRIKARGDANRLRIVRPPFQRRANACDMQDAGGMPRSSPSRRLTRMRAAGVIRTGAKAHACSARRGGSRNPASSCVNSRGRASLGRVFPGGLPSRGGAGAARGQVGGMQTGATRNSGRRGSGRPGDVESTCSTN